jgi:hypothetical protein
MCDSLVWWLTLITPGVLLITGLILKIEICGVRQSCMAQQKKRN